MRSGRFRRGWELTKRSWALLRSHRELMRFPILGALASLAPVVAMVLLFGALSVLGLPVQLFPDIERPQMGIQTGWRAASPQRAASTSQPCKARGRAGAFLRAI